jgi:hypothetical protein
VGAKIGGSAGRQRIKRTEDKGGRTRFATQDVVLAPFEREPLASAFRVRSRRRRGFAR